jgi:hypothetical protein
MNCMPRNAIRLDIFMLEQPLIDELEQPRRTERYSAFIASTVRAPVGVRLTSVAGALRYGIVSSASV